MLYAVYAVTLMSLPPILPGEYNHGWTSSKCKLEWCGPNLLVTNIEKGPWHDWIGYGQKNDKGEIEIYWIPTTSEGRYYYGCYTIASATSSLQGYYCLWGFQTDRTQHKIVPNR